MEERNQTNICYDHGYKDPASLSLSVALNDLCHNQYVREWTAKKSIFKLFYIFCLPELKEALETIRLLASNYGQAENVCFQCVKEGKVVQLTALLMVARDKLLVPTAKGGLKNTPLLQYIVRELRGLDKEITDTLTCSSSNSLMSETLKNRRINILASLDVVRAFWRAYSVLEVRRCFDMKGYEKYEMPSSIAFDLFADTGLLLKPMDVYSDDIECLRARLTPEHEALLNESLEKQMCSGSFMINSLGLVGSAVCDNSSSSADDDIDSEYFVWFRITTALREDKKDKFVQLVAKLDAEEIPRVCSYIYEYDAANCAAAVLDGEVNGFNLSSGLLGAAWTPLHESCRFGRHRLTALLLEKGFSADVRSKHVYKDMKEPLPLEVALSELRSISFIVFWSTAWGGEKSPIKLLMQLCGTRMRHLLENLRLVAQSTKEVKNVFFHFLKEGKMVEVCAFLLVAWKQLLPLSLSTSEGEDIVFNSIREMYVFLSAKKDSKASGYISKDELVESEGTLLLLEIFDSIGDKLAAYVRIPPPKNDIEFERTLEIASLIRAAAFDVKEEDTYTSSVLRVKFDWKVLGRGPPLKKYYQFTPNVKLTSMGKMRGLEALGCRSFHSVSVGSLVSIVPKPNTCRRWTFFVASLIQGLRHV